MPTPILKPYVGCPVVFVTAEIRFGGQVFPSLECPALIQHVYDNGVVDLVYFYAGVTQRQSHAQHEASGKGDHWRYPVAPVDLVEVYGEDEDVPDSGGA